MNEGWVKQKGVFKAFADTTWYGRQGKVYNAENWIIFFDPSGKKVFFQYSKDSAIYTGSREEDGKDAYCEHIEGLSLSGKQCGRTVWKRGNVYLIARANGYKMHEYSIKKGNPEKF